MTGSSGSAKAWLRALELTAPIARERARTLPMVIEEVAARQPEAPALLSDEETLSYGALARRARQYGRWARAHGLRKGDVVCLLMPNRPEYMAVWLGLTRSGVVVALLNTNLVGTSLAHSIRAVSPARIVVDSRLAKVLAGALAHIEQPIAVSIRSPAEQSSPGCEAFDWTAYSGDPLQPEEERSVTIDDLALYIYTSGTTGLPKAARVTHARLMQWSHWFAGMMEVTAADRTYNCLPMYHSVGGVQATGALLITGGSVVVRERFSAGAFSADIRRWQCTLFQYIGELCRYLLHAPPSAGEAHHRLRLACGNGLAPAVWQPFQERYRIPRILEFYAATEGSVSLYNAEGRPGAIGRVPSYLAHRLAPALVRFDSATDAPARNAESRCIRCEPGEAGEALGRIVNDPAALGGRFDGYASAADSSQKVLCDVFAPGDRWFRTGDLLRKDAEGYFYFCDRIGDTFRRKGENVAASEVAAALCAFGGIEHASVYGVAVPHVEGRVGMAALVASGALDLPRLREHLLAALPAYARPLFLRMQREVPLTGTWKYSRTAMLREGYDPGRVKDPLYLDHPEARAFVPLDGPLYERVQSGGLRL